MDVIEISSGSESDCVVEPQPSPKRSWKAQRRARVREARAEVFADENLSPQQKRKLAAERTREIQLAVRRQRCQEHKNMQRQRQEATRETSNERAVAMPSTATPLSTAESEADAEPASEPSKLHTSAHSIRDDSRIDSCNLPFPMADSLPSYNHAAAAAASPPVSTQQPPDTPFAAVYLATDPFPQDKALPAVAQGETLAPAWSDLGEENPRLPSPVVSDSSRDAALQDMSPRRSAMQTTIHQTRRRAQETRQENAAPAGVAATPLRVMMLHWGRLWRHPRQLYRYWIGRPLFRRAEQTNDDAMQDV